MSTRRQAALFHSRLAASISLRRTRRLNWNPQVYRPLFCDSIKRAVHTIHASVLLDPFHGLQDNVRVAGLIGMVRNVRCQGQNLEVENDLAWLEGILFHGGPVGLVGTPMQRLDPLMRSPSEIRFSVEDGSAQDEVMVLL